MTGKGFLVTGTDTGVGKTMVTAALALAVMEKAFSVGVMKPVETGCRPGTGGRLVCRDGNFLSRMTRIGDPLDLVCPERFLAPLAPWSAAAMEGTRVSLARIRRAYQTLAADRQRVFVEGAGGIAVPLKRGYCYSDLALELGLAAIVVSRPALGTINHTVLTVEHLVRRGVPVVGVIFSRAVRAVKGPAATTSPDVIRSQCGVRILGTLDYVARPSAVSLVRAAGGIRLAPFLSGRPAPGV